MAIDDLQRILLHHLQQAHALEVHSLNRLETMIYHATDRQISQALQHHRDQTIEHERRLAHRLDTFGQPKSALRELGAVLGASFEAIGEVLHADNPEKHVRDAYVLEQIEIATYEQLERLAARLGDDCTADICRLNKADEYAMVGHLQNLWDSSVDLILRIADLGDGLQSDHPAPGRPMMHKPPQTSAEADLGLGM